MAQQAQFPGPEWFDSPQGTDCVSDLYRAANNSSPGRVTFLDSKYAGYIRCRVKIRLDSQNPRIVISIAEDMNAISHGGHLVFTVQDNDFRMGIEKPGDLGEEEIGYFKEHYPAWFEGMQRVYYTAIFPSKPGSRISAVQVGAPWKLQGDELEAWTQPRQCAAEANGIYIWNDWQDKYTVVERAQSWMRVLSHMIVTNVPPQINERRAFWAYHQTEPEYLGRLGYGRRPELPWLWSTEEDQSDRTYAKWAPRDPYFYDDDERKWRLGDATRIEREQQRQAIVNVFCPHAVMQPCSNLSRER